jgi:hypothetical protein
VIHDEEMGRRGVNRLGVAGFVLALASVVTAQFLRVVGVHWWGFALFVGEVTALVCAGVAAARLPRCDHCHWPIRNGELMVTLPTGVSRYHLDRACADAAPPEREPAFPGGRGCAPGCCPICGMDDPMGLEPCWGGQEAHQDCADWLGKLPQPDRGQQREQVYLYPTPPLGPGAATLAKSPPSAWEQYRAQGRELKAIRAEVRAIRAKADALPSISEQHAAQLRRLDELGRKFDAELKVIRAKSDHEQR